MPDALSNIWRTEGVRGLFRGNGASVLRIVPYASFHFGAYEYFRRHLVDAGFAGASPASVPPFVDLLAGSTAGASAVLLTYPLDLVRTRLAFHTESNGGGGSSSSSSSAASSSSATRSAAAVCATSSGSSSVGGALAARRGGLAAVQAGGRAAGGLGASTSGMAGAAAAGRGLLHGLPHPANAALTIRGVLVATWQREGLRGMYHGLGASFWGILPYAGLKFYVYQHLKRWYLGFGSSSRAGGAAAAEGTPAAGVARNRQRLPVTLMLGFGAVAGLVAQTATYPVDVVRRRMQVGAAGQRLACRCMALGPAVALHPGVAGGPASASAFCPLTLHSALPCGAAYRWRGYLSMLPCRLGQSPLSSAQPLATSCGPPHRLVNLRLLTSRVLSMRPCFLQTLMDWQTCVHIDWHSSCCCRRRCLAPLALCAGPDAAGGARGLAHPVAWAQHQLHEGGALHRYRLHDIRRTQGLAGPPTEPLTRPQLV